MRSNVLLVFVLTVLVVGFIDVSSGSAASDAQFRVNSLLNNPRVGREYKTYLKQRVEAQSGVTRTSTKAGAVFAKSARFTHSANTRCGAWCCGVKLTPQPRRYTRRVTRTCYHKVTEYYRTRKCWICRKKTRSRRVTRSKVCYSTQPYYRNITPVCRPNQYTRCCEGNVKVFECCVEIEGLNAIIRLIELLIRLGISPSSGGALIGAIG